MQSAVDVVALVELVISSCIVDPWMRGVETVEGGVGGREIAWEFGLVESVVLV